MILCDLKIALKTSKSDLLVKKVVSWAIMVLFRKVISRPLIRNKDFLSKSYRSEVMPKKLTPGHSKFKSLAPKILFLWKFQRKHVCKQHAF